MSPAPSEVNFELPFLEPPRSAGELGWFSPRFRVLRRAVEPWPHNP